MRKGITERGTHRDLERASEGWAQLAWVVLPLSRRAAEFCAGVARALDNRAAVQRMLALFALVAEPLVAAMALRAAIERKGVPFAQGRETARKRPERLRWASSRSPSPFEPEGVQAFWTERPSGA